MSYPLIEMGPATFVTTSDYFGHNAVTTIRFEWGGRLNGLIPILTFPC